MNKNLQTYAHEMRAFVMLNGETSLTELQERFEELNYNEMIMVLNYNLARHFLFRAGDMIVAKETAYTPTQYVQFPQQQSMPIGYVAVNETMLTMLAVSAASIGLLALLLLIIIG